MKEIEAVLFDLDGVLVDTDALHARAWGELARRLGLPFTREQADRCRGVSRMDSLEIVLGAAAGSYTREEKEGFAQEKNERYRAMLQALTPGDAAPGAQAVLSQLRRRGYKLALASSSRNARLILERTGLGVWMDGVADGTCITRSKPDPEVFFTAARLVGAEPSRCMAVDDALAGIAAARAAGMVSVGWGDAAGRGAGEYNLTRLEQLLELLPPREEGP